MNRQDIEWSVSKLNDIYRKVQLEDAGHILFIVELLEELGNLVQDSFASYEAHLHDLRLDNESLKQ